MALIKHDYDLKSLTRVHVGGKASHFILANDIPAVKNAVQFSQNHSLPIYVLGAGTNILINDETFNGIVLKLGGDLNSIKIDENTRTISAGGATPLMKLGFTLAREGCVGYLYMAVIPGTVGGAVRMNAGTSDKGEIKDHFVKALVFDLKASKISEYNFADMQFGHRKSVIAKRNLIILQATFKLPRKEERKIDVVMEDVRSLLRMRWQKQPREVRTFGSTFKKTQEGKPAGWYLDRVGMKGMRIGDAMVATKHANWIINLGEATCNDIKALITIGKKRVFEQFGVNLSREVIYLPEDMENWI